MKKVVWQTAGETYVDTDDDAIAEDQVSELFMGMQWGGTEGRELCLNTSQQMLIVSIESADSDSD